MYRKRIHLIRVVQYRSWKHVRVHVYTRTVYNALCKFITYPAIRSISVAEDQAADACGARQETSAQEAPAELAPGVRRGRPGGGGGRAAAGGRSRCEGGAGLARRASCAGALGQQQCASSRHPCVGPGRRRRVVTRAASGGGGGGGARRHRHRVLQATASETRRWRQAALPGAHQTRAQGTKLPTIHLLCRIFTHAISCNTYRNSYMKSGRIVCKYYSD